MFSRGKKNTVKKSAIVEEKPLFVQFLPFSNMMNERAQVQNALAFTLIMGFVCYTNPIFYKQKSTKKGINAVILLGFLIKNHKKTHKN